MMLSAILRIHQDAKPAKATPNMTVPKLRISAYGICPVFPIIVPSSFGARRLVNHAIATGPLASTGRRSRQAYISREHEHEPTSFAVYARTSARASP